jgi:hypothetical protein
MLRPMRGASSYYDDFPRGLKPGRAMRRVSSNRQGIRLDAMEGARFVWAAAEESQRGVRFQVDILPEGATIRVT